MTAAEKIAALTEALEACLDVMLDGRMDELDEKEQEAVEQADAAIKAQVDSVAALEACKRAESQLRHLMKENSLTVSTPIGLLLDEVCVILSRPVTKAQGSSPADTDRSPSDYAG